MTKLIACVLFAAGCVHARPVEYAGSVTVTSPELISINPDVKTVADSDKPLIFSRGSYWLFHDGHWYRGSAVRGPWVLVERPPVPVAQIDQPYELTHYTKYHAPQTATAQEPERTQPQPQPQPRPLLSTPRSDSLLQFPK